MVTQPKSMATVVVVLWLSARGSSTPMATEVISASVVRGAISEIDRTVVVLPTPKPPATMILTGTGGFFAGGPGWNTAGASGNRMKSMHHSQDGVRGNRAQGVRDVHV